MRCDASTATDALRWMRFSREGFVLASNSDSTGANIMRRAAERLGAVPVDLRAVLADCCEALGAQGASLIAGRDLDATELASVGLGEGTPSAHELSLIHL